MKVHVVFTIVVMLYMYASNSYSSDKATKCDEFAAHPDDPGKWAAGVEDSKLVLGPAVIYCQQALNEYPDTPRFQFQLGRVFYLQGKASEAVDSLVLAAENNYLPAYYYLASILETGVLGEVDMETAETYYSNAIEGGFEIARQAKEDMLNGGAVMEEVVPLADSNQQYVSQQTSLGSSPEKRQKSFSPSGFEYGRLLQSLYEGDFEIIDAIAKERSIFIYLEKIVDIYSQSFVNNDPNGDCEYYASVELGDRVRYKAQGLSSAGRIQSDQLAQAGNIVVSRIQAMLNGRMIDVFSDIAQSEQRRERYVKHAERDASMLAKLYGCKSPVFIHLFDNLEAYVYGKAPDHVSGLTAIRHHCKASAMSKGGSEEESFLVCGCFAAEFDKIGVDRDEINWLGKNYDQGKNFMKLTQKYKGLHEKISECLF